MEKALHGKGIWERMLKKREDRKERYEGTSKVADEIRASIEGTSNKLMYLEQVNAAKESANLAFEQMMNIYSDMDAQNEQMKKIRTEAIADADRLASVIRMMDEEIKVNEATRKGLMHFMNPLGEDEEVRMTATPAEPEAVVSDNDTPN